MPYNPESNETNYWAASKRDCERMETNQGWRLKRTKAHGKGGPLPIDCIFEGDVTFPKVGIDYKAGDDGDD